VPQGDTACNVHPICVCVWSIPAAYTPRGSDSPPAELLTETAQVLFEIGEAGEQLVLLVADEFFACINLARDGASEIVEFLGHIVTELKGLTLHIVDSVDASPFASRERFCSP